MKLKQSPGYPFFRIAFPRFRAIAGYLIFASLYGLELPSASAQDIIGVIVPAKPQPAEDIAADMVLQSGHSGRVTGLVFSSDGDMLASAGDDKTIQLWNVAQGRQIFCLRGHTGAVRAIAFSPDGSHLASGSDDHTIRLWAVQTGKFLATLQMPNESAVHLAFSPDGSRLVAAGGGPYEGGAGPVVLWDVATGREIRTLEREAIGVTRVFFSADSSRVMVADRYGDIDVRGSIRTYDRETGRLLATRAALLKAATDDGDWIALEQGGGGQAEVAIFEASGNRPVATFGANIGPVVFAPGGGWVAFSPYPYSAATVQRSRGGDAQTLNGNGGGPWHVDKLAVSTDGRWLASAGNGTNIEIWDVQAGRLAHTLSGQFGVNALTFDPDGTRLAIGSGGDGEGALRLWDLRTQTALQSPRVDHGIVGASFSPDAKYLVVSSRSLELFAISSGLPVRQFRCASDVVIAPVFSVDGRLIAGNCRGVITVWSVDTGVELLHFGEPNMLNASSVAFSPNGKLLAAGGLQDLRIYDLPARRLAATWPTTAPVSAIAFSRDGRRISAGTRVQLRAQQNAGTLVLAPVPGQAASVSVWDLASGQRLWSAPAGQWVSALVFSPDSKFTLVSSGEDWEGTGSIRLFNADSGQVVRTPIPRVDSHGAAAFSSNADWFAAGPRQPGSGVKLWMLR